MRANALVERATHSTKALDSLLGSKVVFKLLNARCPRSGQWERAAKRSNPVFYRDRWIIV